MSKRVKFTPGERRVLDRVSVRLNELASDLERFVLGKKPATVAELYEIRAGLIEIVEIDVIGEVLGRRDRKARS